MIGNLQKKDYIYKNSNDEYYLIDGRSEKPISMDNIYFPIKINPEMNDDSAFEIIDNNRKFINKTQIREKDIYEELYKEKVNNLESLFISKYFSIVTDEEDGSRIYQLKPEMMAEREVKIPNTLYNSNIRLSPSVTYYDFPNFHNCRFEFFESLDKERTKVQDMNVGKNCSLSLDGSTFLKFQLLKNLKDKQFKNIELYYFKLSGDHTPKAETIYFNDCFLKINEIKTDKSIDIYDSRIKNINSLESERIYINGSLDKLSEYPMKNIKTRELKVEQTYMFDNTYWPFCEDLYLTSKYEKEAIINISNYYLVIQNLIISPEINSIRFMSQHSSGGLVIHKCTKLGNNNRRIKMENLTGFTFYLEIEGKERSNSGWL